jgi:hypothetical protein
MEICINICLIQRLAISEQPALNIGPFNDIVSDDYFDDSSDSNVNQDNSDSTREEQYFDFDDFLPFLKEGDDGHDLESAFHRYEEETGYQNEGEIRPPVQVPEPQVHDPALLRPETLPHQRHGQITVPQRRLPAEGADEPEVVV